MLLQSKDQTAVEHWAPSPLEDLHNVHSSGYGAGDLPMTPFRSMVAIIGMSVFSIWIKICAGVHEVGKGSPGLEFSHCFLPKIMKVHYLEFVQLKITFSSMVNYSKPEWIQSQKDANSRRLYWRECWFGHEGLFFTVNNYFYL